MPHRAKPATGLHLGSDEPTIVFVTACAKDRHPWIACDEAHQLLVTAWRHSDAWLVGHYMLMPDHVHLFAAPRNLRFTIERWITFWKSQFSQSHNHADWSWQPSAFHHRLRRRDSYSQKWTYVQETPSAPAWSPNPPTGPIKAS